MKLNTIYSKMKAFTLAEVLLVVAIIGITAAIALPNLSQNVDEDKYIMLTKTTYNELDSGFARMLANKSLEEIYTDAGATTSAAKAKAIVDELSKYVKMGTNCGNSISQCYNSSKKYTEADGSEIDNKTWQESHSNGAAFTLPSGAVVIVDMYYSIAPRVDFDVDGVKGPCKCNVDIFRAVINDDNFDTLTADLYYFAQGTKRGGNSSFDINYDGLGWVLSIGNMDYLHCNNLNWSTKHQCD